MGKHCESSYHHITSDFWSVPMLWDPHSIAKKGPKVARKTSHDFEWVVRFAREHVGGIWGVPWDIPGDALETLGALWGWLGRPAATLWGPREPSGTPWGSNLIFCDYSEVPCECAGSSFFHWDSNPMSSSRISATDEQLDAYIYTSIYIYIYI